MAGGLVLALAPVLAQAWWNDDWNSRRQVIVDASATGADIQETLTDAPILIRLHAGNFGYFADLAENGRDIRLMKDDKTALKHQVEQVDVLNEIALIWVRLPQVRGGISNDDFWLYYGNANAPDGSDSAGLYDVAQGLVYHFREGEALPQDATAYGSHATDSKAQIQAAGWIGAAAQFTGAGPIRVNPLPQLAIAPDKGWTFSTWLKYEQPQSGTLLQASEAGQGLQLTLNDTALVARWTGAAGTVETAPATLAPGQWHHIAATLRADRLQLYIDGAAVGHAQIQLSALNPSIEIGGTLNLLLDEVQIAATARSDDWLKWVFRSQSPDFTVLGFGQDESNESGDAGHFMVIVQNVTVDGWVVIGLTGIMLVVALLVMVSKALVIKRIGRDNRAFLQQYEGINLQQLDALDQAETEEERELADSDLLTALLGKHDHFQSSPLYHLYHLAIQELKKLGANANDQPLANEAWDYLRVKLDARIVTESQRLNSNMVLLTISIAGGPFLGLLGTVVGVMITFAAIAASGDVNINSIAPGIAAALLATVAGLAVAIPALFAYNYLLIQIKDITASMRVFADEFLALLIMRSAKTTQGS